LPRSNLSILALALLLGAPRALRAQGPGALPTRGFGFEEGLTNLSVTALVQDETNTLWAGTEGGLFRFNGHRFQAIDLPLPARYVQAVLAEPGGGLWLGTFNGLVHWMPGSPSPARVEGVPASTISHLGRDGAGNIWVLSLEGPLVSGDRRTFRSDPTWPRGEQSNALFAWPDSPRILVAAPHRLWIREAPGGAWRVEKLPLHPSETLAGAVWDGDGVLWARSNRSVYRRFPGAPAWEELHPSWPTQAADTPSLTRDRAGWIWINTPAGMVRVKGRREQPVVQGGETGVSTVALLDHEGSTWFGFTGIHQMLGRGLWRTYGTAQGLPDPVVWNVLRDAQGSLWAATDGGIAVGGPTGWSTVRRGQFSRIRNGPGGCLLAVGAPGSVLYRIDPRRRTVEELKVDGLPEAPLMRGLEVSDTGEVWLQNMRDGVVHGVPSGRGYRWQTTLLDGKPLSNVWSIIGCGRHIFLSTRDALHEWSGGRWQAVEGALPDSTLAAVITARGELVVAYLNQPALTRHALEGGRWVLKEVIRPFPTQPGLVLYSLALDAAQRLWVGTSEGLARLDAPWTGVPRWFGAGEGIPGPDATSQGLYVDPVDGDIWFGTSQGVGRYHAAGEQEEPVNPPPDLLQVRVSGRDLPLPFGPLPAHAVMEASFAFNSFLHPTRTRLQARLSGVDPDWVTLQEFHVRYPDLRPGNYTLEVRGAPLGGNPGPSRAIRFQVAPAWWQTWWALALDGLALFLALAGFVRFRQAALRRRNEVLHATVETRTRELVALNGSLALERERADHASKAKSAFLASMSHELRTPLNAILLYSELVRDEARDRGEESTVQDLEKIRTSGTHLLAMINSILDLSKIEAGHMVLDGSPVDLQVLLKEVAATLAPLAAKQGDRILIECQEGLPAFFTDNLRLRQVMLNLLSNACKFTEEGQVTLGAARSGPGLVLTVTDTGIGMSEEEVARVFDAFEQASQDTARKFGGTGLGLAISKGLVNLMGGTLAVTSRPGRGSSFTVTFPAAFAAG